MPIPVVDAPLDPGDALRLVARRHWLAWLRIRWQVAPEVLREAGSLYWPIYLIRARVVYRPALRRPVQLRWLGAVDGVTGRAGNAEIRVPPRVLRDVDPAQVIPSRYAQEQILQTWRVFARRFVEVRYKPVEIRELSVEDLEHCYLPYCVVVGAGKTYLIDCLMRRVDPLSELPELDFFFAGGPPERDSASDFGKGE